MNNFFSIDRQSWNRGERINRHNAKVNLRKLVLIALRQFSDELYNILEIWELIDLKFLTHSGTDAEEAKT